MDHFKVILKCSIKWLSGVLKSRVPDNEWQITLDNYIWGNMIKQNCDIIQILTQPHLYCTVFKSIQPSEDLPLSQETFWPLIHALAHQGIYLVDAQSDANINHSMIASTNPFRESVHCVLIEGLMECYASTLAPTVKVVRSIRQISGLSASKELPSSTEEALLLWVNKIGKATLEREQQLHQTMLQEPDPIKRRQYRLKALQEGGVKEGFPKATNISSGLTDGQCIAAAILYYAKDDLNWTDFHFSHQPLARKEALINLNKIKSYCDHHLSLPSLHIEPELWFEHTSSGHLNINILAFLAHLYSSLDTSATHAKVPTNTMSSSSHLEESSKDVFNHTSTSTPLKSKKSKKKYPITAVKKPQSILNLSSISTASLPAHNNTCTCAGPRCTCTNIEQHESSALSARGMQSSNTLHSLSLNNISNSSVVDMEGKRNKAQRTLFPAAVRNSSSTIQTALLSSFSKNNPFPVWGVNQQPSFGKDSMSTSNLPRLITASVENLGIRSQMEQASQLKHLNRLSNDQNQENERTTAKDNTSTVSSVTSTLPISTVTTDNAVPKSSSLEPESTSKDEESVEEISSHQPIKLKFVRPSSKDTQERGTTGTPPPDTHGLVGKDDVILKSHSVIIDLDQLQDRNKAAAKLSVNAQQMDVKEIKQKDFSHTVLQPKLEIDDLVSCLKKLQGGAVMELLPAIKEEKLDSTNDEEGILGPLYLHIFPLEPNTSPGELKVDTSDLLLQAKLQSKMKEVKEKMRKAQSKEIEISQLVNKKVFFDVMLQDKPTSESDTVVDEIILNPIAETEGEENGNVTRPSSRQGTGHRRVKRNQDNVLIMKEERRRRRGEEIKLRLEERERERKSALQERRRRHQENVIEATHLQKKEKMSTQQRHQDIVSTVNVVTTEGSLRGQVRSNKKLVRNALSYICLAGEANIALKQKALTELELSDAGHFLILFRDHLSLKFKGLYGYSSDNHYFRLFGTGPKTITEGMVEKLYKYNCGTKSFQCIPSRTFSISVDALTVQDHYWTTRKRTITSSSHLK